MKWAPISSIPDIKHIQMSLSSDLRGYFYELFRQDSLKGIGIDGQFVQDNISFSKKNVIRGLHGQRSIQQGKFVSAINGEILDIAVDIRISSPTFKRWVAIPIYGTNCVYIPPGFLHGFAVLSDSATVFYKCTSFYTNHDDQIRVRWDDPDLGIHWPIKDPILSNEDKQAPFLKEIIL